jgi:hypothetical protein
MLKKILFLIFFPLSIYCQNQSFKNYTEVSKHESDFNKDNQIDKIVVYEKDCDESNENSKCRRVAIFLKIKGKYILYGYNDNLIICSTCGGAGIGDPFRDIKVKNQYFSIESLYGACDKTFEVITFKFDDKSKEFYLYKIGTEDYSCREEDNPGGEIKVKKKTETKNNFGKIKFTEYN